MHLKKVLGGNHKKIFLSFAPTSFMLSYVQPAYSAKDNYDGDLTKKVVITNNIDTTKAGIYDVIYEVRGT